MFDAENEEERGERAVRSKHETGGLTSGVYRGHAYCCAPTGLDVIGVKLSSHCVFLLALKGSEWRNTLLLRTDFHKAVTTESKRPTFPRKPRRPSLKSAHVGQHIVNPEWSSVTEFHSLLSGR